MVNRSKSEDYKKRGDEMIIDDIIMIHIFSAFDSGRSNRNSREARRDEILFNNND